MRQNGKNIDESFEKLAEEIRLNYKHSKPENKCNVGKFDRNCFYCDKC